MIFESYLNCKYKAFLKSEGKQGNKSDYEILQDELNNEYKNKVKESLLAKYGVDGFLKTDPTLFSDLKKGKEIIFNSRFEHSELEANPNVLVKAPGESVLGSFHYAPIQFYKNDRVHKSHRILSAFHAYVIGIAQQKVPLYAQIIYGSTQRKTQVKVETYLHQVRKIIQEIKEYQNDKTIAQLLLNSHCTICEFKDLCRDKAREEDNLSLLSGTSAKEIKKQNKNGIFTVTQYSYTFRPRKRGKRVKTKSIIHYGALKALAIRENKIYIYGNFKMSKSPVLIYLDIEGDPDQGFDYLIGLIVVKNNSTKHYSFWADSKQQEEFIFNQFIQELKQYDDYCIYHYGSYEIAFLKKMGKSLDDKDRKWLDDILNKCIDIFCIIHSTIYFPTYSNSLKDIAVYLGFSWKSNESSGIQSLVWRKRWELTGDTELKEKLIQYNIEDCLALQRVTEFIYKILSDSNKENIEGRNIADAQNVVRNMDYRFKKQRFFHEDFEYINKCSYFDYQREKIFIRTNKTLKRIQVREQKLVKKVNQINKSILVSSNQCPQCKHEDLHVLEYPKKKDVIDLRFSSGGVKRWIVQYTTFSYKCKRCQKSFVPMEYRNIKQRYGHGLISWCIYQYITNRQSYQLIQKSLSDVFSISIPLMSLYDLKSDAAEFYQKTYENILHKVATSHLIHADETSIKLQKERGYIWVFTNIEDAVFMYKSTREGEFLFEFLKDFSGVLITDFYSAYDSIDCPQQKCLVHLIRDLNKDLLQNAFDEEYKEMVKDFATLLRRIVVTIDKYGLKKRHLNKHKPEVQKYLKQIANRKYHSELAEKYQKRFKKNTLKLFTFLDYDGVPWNNNYAEHAVKAFANHRTLFNGQVSEQGMKDYVVLLSLYQTCKYKGINFLDFLLSKAVDVDCFQDFNKRTRYNHDLGLSQ